MITHQATRTFAAVYQQVDGWWIGWLEDLPGANGQGRTLDEARASLRDATELILGAGGIVEASEADELIGEDALREPLTV